MTAPLRSIIENAGTGRPTRQGIMKTSVLECGHILDTNAGTRRTGKAHCWDCYYGKPVTPLGRTIAAQYGVELPDTF